MNLNELDSVRRSANANQCQSTHHVESAAATTTTKIDYYFVLILNAINTLSQWCSCSPIQLVRLRRVCVCASMYRHFFAWWLDYFHFLPHHWHTVCRFILVYIYFFVVPTLFVRQDKCAAALPFVDHLVTVSVQFLLLTVCCCPVRNR